MGYKLNVTPGAVLYSNKERSYAAYRIRERRSALNRDAFYKFIGYAISIMTLMSNKGKEKYIKELFRRKSSYFERTLYLISNEV